MSSTPRSGPIAVYALGVLALGLIDDTLGERAHGDTGDERAAPRGWRGHGSAVLRGELSTGALKAAGSLGLALLGDEPARASPTGAGCWPSACSCWRPTLFNLLDLRPGRSTKAFVLLGLGLTIGAGEPAPLWTLGLFAAPALVAGLYDLRERAMLGDTGANLLGALAGLWLVLTLSGTGQVIALDPARRDDRLWRASLDLRACRKDSGAARN